MCVAFPARIIQITAGPLPMASVSIAGRIDECCLAYVPEAAVGDDVLIQNGFAVEVLTPEAAAESRAAFAELGLLIAGGEDS